jgi:sulfhydrogenase subunit delta
MEKPKVGIYGLTSCAGDQLSILNCEDHLLGLAQLLDIRSFAMAQTRNDDSCELDVAFVEGCVAQLRDLETLRAIRKRSQLLVALGTCAVWGGIAAMKNEIPRETMKEEVYGVDLDFIESIEAQPLKSFVAVDVSLPGCPIERYEFLSVVSSLLNGDLPERLNFSVCAACKMKENICLLVENNEICCGPLTVSGCNARCPSHNIPCGGCHGPLEETHFDASVSVLRERGVTKLDIQKKMATFSAPRLLQYRLLKEYEK